MKPLSSYQILVATHTVHKTAIFCWLRSHIGISGNERADSVAKAALQKDVSDCLILYIDAYQSIRMRFVATRMGHGCYNKLNMLQNPWAVNSRPPTDP